MAFLPLPKKFHPDFAIPNKQPLGGVEIDHNNSISRGVYEYYLPFSNGVRGVTDGMHLPTRNPANVTPVHNAIGRALATVSDHEIDVPAKSYATGDEYSITWLASKTTTANNEGMICGDPASGNNFLWMTNSTNTVRVRRDGNDTDLSITGVNNDAHVWRTFTIKQEGAGVRVTYYADRQSATTTDSLDTFQFTDVASGYVNTTFNLGGVFQGIVFHDRALSEREVFSLHDDPYQILKPATQTGYFTAEAGVTSALTGTATATITETDITDGGKTIIITLTGDTFKGAGTGPIGSTADTQAFIDGFDAAASPANGWNNEVRDKALTSEVVRTSSTIATWTISAQAGYDISAQETITGTIPTDVLVTGAGAITSTPTFTIDPVVSGRIMGSLAGAGGLAGIGGLAGRRGGMAG